MNDKMVAVEASAAVAPVAVGRTGRRRFDEAPPEQPFKYPLERPFVEPDWTRIPAYRGVSAAEWENAVWQRKHTIKNLKELKAALGDFLPEDLAESIERDQK